MLLLAVYIILSVSGATLIKYAGIAQVAPLFTVPIANLVINWVNLLGILTYGFSFALYIILLNKLDLSFLTPVTTAVVYTSLLVISVLLFNEHFTLLKTIGCILVLVGIILVVINK